MTNVIKLPDMHRLQIEILDWSFNDRDRSIDIVYCKDGLKEKNIRLDRKQLLDMLNRCFIIDRHDGEDVEFHMDTEESTGEDMRQRRYNYRCKLAEFMEELFNSDDVCRMVKYLEEQEMIRHQAKLVADKIQHQIKPLGANI